MKQSELAAVPNPKDILVRRDGHGGAVVFHDKTQSLTLSRQQVEALILLLQLAIGEVKADLDLPDPHHNHLDNVYGR